jgi:hypothetical protein
MASLLVKAIYQCLPPLLKAHLKYDFFKCCYSYCIPIRNYALQLIIHADTRVLIRGLTARNGSWSEHGESSHDGTAI